MKTARCTTCQEAKARATECLGALNDAQARIVDLEAALRRAVPWLGKLIADGAHMNAVAPNDAVGALQQAEAILQGVTA